jgi:hypothetical protein
MNNFRDKILYQWDNKPLLIIIFIAALFRLLAAIFSKGFAMHDDHFQIIEIAQSWLEGSQIWLNEVGTINRSLVYPGLHYLLFRLIENLGLTDPQTKMTIVRFIHAFYSLLLVYFGYKITLIISDKPTAKKVGLFLAIFYIMPFMSVRNLIEVVCFPPMIIGFYFALNEDPKKTFKNWILAGIFLGLAVTIRYQILIIVGSAGLVLIFQKNFKILFIYTLGLFLGHFIIEGIVNLIAWGSPYHPTINYIFYNIKARYEYVVGPWYRYILLILGILIPPISIFLVFGYLKNWRKLALLFWPALIFLVAHSYFPNKQERFILPILPFIIISGVIGWEEFIKNSKFWQNKQKILRSCWIWFWSINSILLLIVTFTYSKKNQVETLYYLSQKKVITGIIWESHRRITPHIPHFYLNRKVPFYQYPAPVTNVELAAEIDSSGNPAPNYIIFLGKKGIQARVNEFQNDFDVILQLEKLVNPSLIDAILYQLNPGRNVNQVSYVYKIHKNPVLKNN